MENASKALLIAASVLIVILLIAFGVRIFNSTSGTADNIDGVMQTTEITIFNNKFLAYTGTQSASQVKALVNLVIANNSNNSNKKVEININGGGYCTSSAQISKNILPIIVNSAKYNVSIEDENGDGYLDKITLTKPS